MRACQEACIYLGSNIYRGNIYFGKATKFRGNIGITLTPLSFPYFTYVYLLSTS